MTTFEDAYAKAMLADARAMRKLPIQREAPVYRAPSIMMPRGISDDDLKADAKTMTAQQIANKHGVTPEHIGRRLRRIGVCAINGRKQTPDVIEKIKAMKGRGMSNKAVGNRLGMSHTRVWQLWKENQ